MILAQDAVVMLVMRQALVPVEHPGLANKKLVKTWKSNQNFRWEIFTIFEVTR